MTSGVGRRLVAGIAVTAAIAGGTAISAGPAAAQGFGIEPIPILGSLDAGSQVPAGYVGLGELTDIYLVWFACLGVTGSAELTSSDLPDAVRERCIVHRGPSVG